MSDFKPYPKSSSMQHNREEKPKPAKAKMTASEFQQKYGSKIGTKSVFVTPKVRKPIKKRSEKMSKLDRQYYNLRKEFLETRMKCECKGCHNISTDIHHKAGKVGDLYLDVTKWLAVCRECHIAIEINPTWAKSHGYSLDRLSI